MRKKLILGNWKMFKLPATASTDFCSAAEATKKFESKLDMGIAAPFVSLPGISERAGRSHLMLLAQNCHWEKEGAFTGEVSTEMLKALQVSGALVAHSERRQMFGETNVSAGKRVAALLAADLHAVLCVGETLAERESGKLEDTLRAQLLEAFAAGNLQGGASRPRLSIAYEPVWAIGTGKAATPTEAHEAHAFIRGVLREHFGETVAAATRILYGGSVKPGNISDFTRSVEVDGALVGGASLAPADFASLCEKVTESL